MQNRVDRLEKLLFAMVRGGSNGGTEAAAAATTEDSTAMTDKTSYSARAGHNVSAKINNDEYGDIDGKLASSLGALSIDPKKGKSVYTGQEHWHSILSEIAEVKTYFAHQGRRKMELEASCEEVQMSKPAHGTEGLTLLLGYAPPATDAELRAALPPRSTILTLCSRYFTAIDQLNTIVHSLAFYQQLETYWSNPSNTSTMWLGLLYSILCRAMLSYNTLGDEPAVWRGRTLEMAANYRVRTVQCLITADYTKPVEYTVETMLLYMFGEASTRWDADFGIWLNVSLITRIAIYMGYHRDGKWFPSLTPFQSVGIHAAFGQA